MKEGNTLPRLVVTWIPQAWRRNDYAVDIDGQQQFDATETALRRDLEWWRTFEPWNYSSDELADGQLFREAHSGPFEVDAESEFVDFLEAHGLTQEMMTQADLDRLRRIYGVDEKKPAPSAAEKLKAMSVPATVGELRRLIAALSDEAEIKPDWVGDPPSDDEPGVKIRGIGLGFEDGSAYLSVKVGLFYLNEETDGES